MALKGMAQTCQSIVEACVVHGSISYVPFVWSGQEEGQEPDQFLYWDFKSDFITGQLRLVLMPTPGMEVQGMHFLFYRHRWLERQGQHPPPHPPQFQENKTCRWTNGSLTFSWPWSYD